jgi:phosphoglycolate phosphatase
MALEIIVFDFDGTLANTPERIIKYGNEVLVNHGYPAVSKEEVEKMRALHAKEVLIKHLNIKWYSGYKWLLLPGMLEEGRKLFAKTQDSVMPYEGIVDIINELAKTKKIITVSSNKKEVIETTFKRWGLDCNEVHHCAKLFGKGYELKRIIRENKLQYKKDKIIYVGDEVRDAYACYYAGIGMVAATWGLNSAEAFKNMGFPKEYMVDSPKEMDKRLREL